MGSRDGHKVQKDARGCTSTTTSTHPARRCLVADSHAGAASTWLDATSTFDDELGPILGTTKQNNRQNISFGPARSAAELEAAEAAKERYREALRDARGYVSETVTPQKQHPVAQPPRDTSSKDEDDEYAEDSNDGDEFVEDNDHALLAVEAEAKVALRPCSLYTSFVESLQPRAIAPRFLSGPCRCKGGRARGGGEGARGADFSASYAGRYRRDRAVGGVGGWGGGSPGESRRSV